MCKVRRLKSDCVLIKCITMSYLNKHWPVTPKPYQSNDFGIDLRKKDVWAHTQKKSVQFFAFSFLSSFFPSTQFCSKLCLVQLEQTKEPKEEALAFSTKDCARQVEEAVGSQ